MDRYFSSVQKRLSDTQQQREVIKEGLKTSVQKRMLKEALRSPIEDEIEPEPDVSGDFDPDAEGPVGAVENEPKIDLDAAEPVAEPEKPGVSPEDKEETLIAIVDKAREAHDDLMSMSGLAAAPELNDWTTRAKIDALTKEVNRIHNKYNDELGSIGGDKGREYLETEKKPEKPEATEEPPPTKRPAMKTEPLELEGVDYIANSITEDPDISNEADDEA